MSIRLALILALITIVSNTCGAQSRTQNGATLGGVAGAVIGGIIGHQNDETPEGILIGGAVGAVTGGIIGRVQDNELARQRAQQEQAYYASQQQVYARQQAFMLSGVSMNDVIHMSRSGVSEAVMLSHIQSQGVQRRLEVSDIITLHQQGVSDTLINVMQQAPLAGHLATPVPPPRSVIVQQPNVIVREQPVIYRSPVVVEQYYRSHPAHRHHYPSPRGSSFYYGF